MLNFGKFLFSEAVTMNGKKVGDDDTKTDSGSTTTNDTKTSTTPGMGVDSDSDYTKMDRDDTPATGTGGTDTPTTTGGSDDDVDDYTKMDRDDTPTSTSGTGGTGTSSFGNTTSTDTTTGGSETTSSTPGITPTTGGDTGGAEDDVDDYTKMDRDDTPASGTGGTDTPTTTGATGTDAMTPTDTDDVDDYTKMDRDDTPNTNDVGGGDLNATQTDSTNPQTPDSGDTGTNPDGSDPNTGGGAASEPDVDYGKMYPSGDDQSDSGDGSGDNVQGDQGGNQTTGDPQNPQDPNNANGMDSGTDPQQALRDIESKLFSELSPEQLQIKDNELKIQYINLYEDIEKTEQRVNRIVKTENNEDVVAFISKKLDDLKTLVHRILTETYQTQTWLQNMLTYQHCLSIFAGIGELLHNLSKKDNINKNIDKDDKIEDLTNDVITSTSSEG